MNVKIVRTWIDKNQPNGMTKLAAAAGLSTQTIGAVLNGHEPTLRTAKAIAAALGVTIGEASTNQDEEPPAA